MNRHRASLLLVLATGMLLWASGCSDDGPPASNETLSQAETVKAQPAAPSEAALPKLAPKRADVPPPPPVDVIGGGPSDPAAVRMQAVLPVVENTTQIDGSQALDYAGQIAEFIPAVSKVFDALSAGVDCAVTHGAIGVRAYIASDLGSASAIAILSKSQIQNAPSIAADCLVQEVLGGGGSDEWSPCTRSYNFDAVVSEVTDTYYVFLVSTSESMCDLISSAHAHLNPRQGF